jgi:hypothetical protein
MHKTGITRAAAVSHTAWSKRAVAHPGVFGVLAAGEVSESFARTVCIWTDKLSAGPRDAADGILMAAAGSGLGLRDLAVLASEMLARSWEPEKRTRRRRLSRMIKVAGRTRIRAGSGMRCSRIVR